MTPEEISTMNQAKLKREYARSLNRLLDKQRKLIEALVAGQPRKEAAATAGYSVASITQALNRPAMIDALALGREMVSRTISKTAEWVRSELTELLETAKSEGNLKVVTDTLREFSKLDGLYAVEQVKLLHANHEGGPLTRDISEDEWVMLSTLRHEMRDGEESDQAIH